MSPIFKVIGKPFASDSAIEYDAGAKNPANA